MASSSAPSWKYDVFLTSSSQDAGNCSYLLHKYLKDGGILTYRDNQQEVEGAENTASLELGIRQSRVAMVIISPDYASSPRHLEQLVQILETKRDSSSLILPLFHLVEPSQVRKQSGTIGASFVKHEEEQDLDKVQRWRAALTSVAKFSGWHTESHKDQTAFIKDFVETVRRFILREETEKIIKQYVDEVSSYHNVEEKIISVSDNNEHEENNLPTDATSSAEWSFLLYTLTLEVLSAGFDQASSPSKPHYALFAMLLAGAALFTCIWELIQKKSIEMKSWGKLQCISYPQLSDTILESHLDTFGFVSSIYQCVFSAVQYGYFFHHANSPISLCALPSLYLLCLAGTRLQKLHHNSSYLAR